MEDITGADSVHAKRVWKDVEIKNSGKHYDCYVQNNTLLLADVFKNFWNMCLKIDEFDSNRLLQAPLKKTKVKLDLLTDIDALLMAEKRYYWRNMSLYLSICKS